MRMAFLKTQAGVAAFATVAALGMALALSGCPISADNRNTDMGGPGDVFGGTGQQPTSQVMVTVTGIPPAYNGRDVRVRLFSYPSIDCEDSGCEAACACTTDSPWGTTLCICSDHLASATVAGGNFTVVWQNVVFPRDYRINVWLAGDTATASGTTHSFGREIFAGDNPVISWGEHSTP